MKQINFPLVETCWKHGDNQVSSVMNVTFVFIVRNSMYSLLSNFAFAVPFGSFAVFFPQFYRCFLALLCCEAPRQGSSVKSSSKVATKAVRGEAVAGPRRTNDFLIMIASLGQPAATVPQLGPSFEATNDITKAPSSDTNKPVVVSLVAHFDG